MTHDDLKQHSRLQAFIHHETTAGLILVLAAALAMVLFNISDTREVYSKILETPFTISYGEFGLSKTAHHWINDGLMAIFFFLVGLEIKRELHEGNLSSRDQVVLPGLAAIGGMIAPALVFLAIAGWNGAFMRGWAIPAATDIAFALAALSIAGRRAPPALKVFLLTLATLDDLGAIIIIALFYTSDLSVLSLGLAGLAIAALIIMNRMGVERFGIYLLLGVALWVFVLKSGVHATLAGVALALTVPLRTSDGTELIAKLEEKLHPYVTFLILPLFAFANAGVPIDGLSLSSLSSPLPLAISAGLVVGKPLGILTVVGAVVLLGLARLPEGCTWRHMTGVACIAGIGFTMSLFIGTLAFADPELADDVRAGVIAGSLMSTALGLTLFFLPERKAAGGDQRF